MNLRGQIENDFINARKEKNEAKVSVLGMLKAAILNSEIAARPKEFTEEDVLKVVMSEVKKHKDSISEYEKGGREDLVSKEKSEMEILAQYLPAQMSEEELKKIVADKIQEIGASGQGDFGKVMGAVVRAAAGRASGDAVSRVVKEMLGI
jgi:uncharacterized protein YqeY